MRLFVLATGLLLLHLLPAQSQGYEAGSYVLSDSPTVRRPGELKWKNHDHLLLKTISGEKSQLTPQQVASFRLGSRKFVTVGRFQVASGMGAFEVEEAFVEQVDSGQVVLLRFDYLVSSGGAYGGSSIPRSTYLLRQGYSFASLPTNGTTAGGAAFREALLPFLRDRPDMISQLNDKRLLPEDMPLVVHALNTGQPLPPLPSYLNRE